MLSVPARRAGQNYCITKVELLFIIRPNCDCVHLTAGRLQRGMPYTACVTKPNVKNCI